MTTNKTVLSWIDEIKALVKPDSVMWIDGSDEQLAVDGLVKLVESGFSE